MKKALASVAWSLMTLQAALGQIALCPGALVDISAPDSLTNVVWDTGDSTSVITVDAAGMYTYTSLWESIVVNGAIEVINGTVPNMPTILDAELCNGEAYEAFSGLDSQFAWSWSCDNPSIGLGLESSGAGTDVSFTAQALATVTANFTLTGESSDGCTNTVDWIVEVSPTPNLNAIQLPDVCAGNQVVVNLEECCTSAPLTGVQFEWNATSNGPDAASGFGPVLEFVPQSEGEFEIAVIATQGACSSESSLSLSVFAYPDFSIPSSLFACAGEEVVIEAELANAGLQPMWDWVISNSNAVADEVIASNVLTLTAVNESALELETTTVVVNANSNGCMVNKELELTVHGLPEIDVLDALDVCGGTEIQFPEVPTFGASTVEVEWEIGGNGVLPMLSGTNNLPEGVVAPNSGVVQSDMMALTPSASGCVGLPSLLEISIQPTPELSELTVDNSLCPGDTWSYHFQDGLDGIVPSSTVIAWNVANSVAGLVEVPEGAMNLAVELGVIDHIQPEFVSIPVEISASAGACVGGNLVSELNLQPALNPSIEGNLVICEGEEVMLLANEPSGRPTSFTWGDAGTEFFHEGNSYWGTLPSMSSLALTAIDVETGCSFSSVEAIQVDEMVAYELQVSGPLQFCAGQSVSFQVASTSDVLWNTGAVDDVLVVSETGVYSATLSAGACHEEVGPFYVEVLDSPEVQVSGVTEACQGDALVYAAEGEGLVRWFVNGNLANVGSPSIDILAQSDMWLEASIEDIHGCLAFDSLEISVEPAIGFSIPDVVQRCPEDTVTISEAQWMEGWSWTGVFDGEQPSIDVPPGADGLIFISTDETANCVWTDSVEIQSLDVPALSIFNDEGVCLGDSVVFEIDMSLTGTVWEVVGGEGELTGELFVVTQIVDSVDILLVGVQGETEETGCLVSDEAEVDILGALPEEVVVVDLGFGIFVFPIELDIIRWGVTDVLTGNELVVQEGVQLFSFEDYNSSQYEKWVDYGTFPFCLRRADLQGGITSVDESSLRLSLYPNPVRNEFVLDWGVSGQNLDVTIRDPLGRVVRTYPNVSSGSVLHTGDLPPAMYVVQCDLDGRVVDAFKIEKQ